MAFFIPYTIQKRLLRYVLSNLELLDTEHLDLDRLDVGWGRRSTVELRNIGLRKDKLSTLLQLPSAFSITDASITCLRVTVPADLYASSVEVEAIGASVVVDLVEGVDEQQQTPQPQGSPDKTRYSRGSRSGPRNAPGSRTDIAKEEALPTPRDLAQSFLEQEPVAEKEYLEAELNSRSTNLQQSIASSETDSEPPYYGAGQGFGLPSFLAGFIAGIGERLKVAVRELTIEVRLNLDETSINLLDGRNKSSATPLSVIVQVESLEVPGIGDRPSPNQETIARASIYRKIVLSGIKITLRAESKVSDEWTAFLHRGEAAVPQASPSNSWPTGYRPVLSREDTLTKVQSSRSLPDEPPKYGMGSLAGRINAPRTPASLSADDSTHDVPKNSRILASGVVQDPQSDNLPQCQSHQSAHIQRMPQSLCDTGGMSKASSQTPDYSFEADGNSPPDRAFSVDSPSPFGALSASSSTTSASARDSSPTRDHADEPSPLQDLTESHLFSHAEAQSLYVSAIYEPTANVESPPHIPGAWSNSVTDDGNGRSMEREDERLFDETNKVGKSDTQQRSLLTTQSRLGGSGDFTQHSLIDIDRLEVRLPSTTEGESLVESRQGTKNTNRYPRACNNATSAREATGPFPVRSSLASSRTDLDTEPVLAIAVPQNRHVSAIELEISKINGDISFTTCAILLQSAKQVLVSCLGSQPLPQNTKATPRSDTPTLRRQIQIRLADIHMALTEDGKARSATAPETSFEPSAPRGSDTSSLIKVLIQEADLCLKFADKLESCSIDVAKLSIESTDQLQLEFSQENTTATSRGSKSSIQKDLVITYDRTTHQPELNVTTLPIRVQADIHKVDETISLIGGISLLLEAGSSILSDTLQSSSSERKHRNSTPVRTVHFEAAATKSTHLSEDDSQVKVNMRIGGAVVEVSSRACDLNLQTSAVKIIVRSNVIGAHIDDMLLVGPVGPSHDGHRAATVKVHNLGLKYLHRPEEHDLTRLISLLTPSQDKFAEEDDILVDTLISQRRRGAVARVSMAQLTGDMVDYTNLHTFEELRAEILKLATVTKYLPQDSRPGLLSLVSAKELTLRLGDSVALGRMAVDLSGVEVAHVGSPSLFALGVREVRVTRNESHQLIHRVASNHTSLASLMFMARLIGDELEPTIKIKFFNTCVEYDVAQILELMGVQDLEVEAAQHLAASISLVSNVPSSKTTNEKLSADDADVPAQWPRFDMQLRDCAVGLRPKVYPAKAMLVLSEARVTGSIPIKDDTPLRVSIAKGSICLVDDVVRLLPVGTETPRRAESQGAGSGLVMELCRRGYVSVGWISAAHLTVASSSSPNDDAPHVDVTLQDALVVMETCADSTQTLAEVFGSLQLPQPPSNVRKYQTEVAPMDDLMASFTGDAFTNVAEPVDTELDDSLLEEDLHVAMEQLAENVSDEDNESLGGSLFVSSPLKISQRTEERPSHGSPRLAASAESREATVSGVRANALPRQAQAAALTWDSSRNQYATVSASEAASSPYILTTKNLHLIWNLHDGYDWSNTRETISKAVQQVEDRSEAKRSRRRSSTVDEDDDESVIGDFLFNSIYIGVPVSQDPRELARNINLDIGDHMSETASHTSTATKRTSYGLKPLRTSKRKLRLERSKRHKLTIELRGIASNTFVFPSGGETASSTDFRIGDLEIFDHVPTSTWKKFATYMVDMGPREDRKPMVHLEICDVKPVPELVASELVIRTTVLPMRLHVDQDTLDFLTRFFEFDDATANPPASPAGQTYIQRIEVRPVPIKLDYKPKKVDYAGLRSGRTKEFMNFFNLDGADMVLKHAILYGCPSFAKLHQSLEDIWMPDIKRNQLPGIISGLNGVRTLVNVGSGVRNLIVVPINEYQKDGRIVRSVAKGASSFARTTGSELSKFGARLAIGAQNALQTAEDLLSGPRDIKDLEWEALQADEAEEPRALSNFADQPLGILQGLKGAARSLERDLLLTRDVIIAVSAEAQESGSVEGAAKAVARHAPTMILRPMIGASKAISQTLMGAANTADPQNRRRAEDKYKRY